MENSGQKILVVDDDPRLRDLLRRYLGEQGFTVLVAASGRYPAPSTAGAPGDVPPLASLTAGPGNADLAGFQAALAAGANIPEPVPPQRWDIDACYSPGAALRLFLGMHARCSSPCK